MEQRYHTDNIILTTSKVMTNDKIELQDLKRKIYIKAKAEK
ncbi:Uncharacterised protein [Orientia tsutsugamushi]|uniref:Uncharacterized protein n=1 Tax=Orientia tsutsugamushi TaxID=784 RepID=A0A2U3RMK5_ORITS|nr:Uncharacterised protein [Orientia tsutsugamushi]